MTEFRIAIDALTVAVSPDNDWADCLTFSDCARSGTLSSSVSNWNEVDASYPDEPLALFSPGADSGTFDYFTEEVNGIVTQARDGLVVTFSEDDNVLVQGVARTKGRIGLLRVRLLTRRTGRQLKALQIDRDIDRTGSRCPSSAAPRAACARARTTVSGGDVSPLAPTVHVCVE